MLQLSANARLPKKQLKQLLDGEGRPAVCSIEGCHAQEGLQIHHVHPVQFGGADAVQNLTYLCRDHHALVERYYFFKRAIAHPELSAVVTYYHRAFKSGAFLPEEVEAAQADSRGAREAFEAATSKHPVYWQDVFREASRWASQQEVIRSVSPASAMFETTPWYRPRSGVNRATSAVVLPFRKPAQAHKFAAS